MHRDEPELNPENWKKEEEFPVCTGMNRSSGVFSEEAAASSLYAQG